MLQDTKSHSLAGFLVERLQPRLLRRWPGDLQDGQALAERQAAQRPRRGRRGALQGDPGDQDHGAALELPLAHRREGDPPRPLQADQGRVLHRGHPPDGRLPRQPVRDRGRPRLREGAGPGGAGRRRRPRSRWPKARTARTTASSPASSATRTASRSSISSRACATFKAVLETAWRNYGLAQSRGALPAGPMVVFVHMASVWVPFTSESKEAIADYDEIRKEIKLALQECGRRLGVFLRRRERAKSEFRRRNIFELYIEEVVEACARLKGARLAEAAAQGPAPEDRREADGRRRGPTRSWATTAGPRASPTPSSSPPRARGRGAGAAAGRLRRRRARRARHVRRDRPARRTAGRRAGGSKAAPATPEKRPAKAAPDPRRCQAEGEVEDRMAAKAKTTGVVEKKLIGVADVVIQAAERSKDPTLAHPRPQPRQRELQREAAASSRWGRPSRSAPSSTSAWPRSSCRPCWWPTPWSSCSGRT